MQQLSGAVELFQGDVALASNHLPEALEHYADSLEEAEARGLRGQVVMDIVDVAHTLAALRDDAAALEVAGLAEAECSDVNGPGTTLPIGFGAPAALAAAEERAWTRPHRELKARGRSVPAGNRIARACQLARIRQPV